MKTTKLILILVLAFCFTMFNGCSNEGSFIEEIEEVTELEKIEVFKADTKGSTETANKTEDWFNQNSNGNGEQVPEEGYSSVSETMLFIVEFELVNGQPLSSTEKTAARDRYIDYLGFISHTVCSNNPEKEIWTLNTAIYNDDTIPVPICPGCPQNGGPGSGGKSTHVGNDPDFSRVAVSVTSHPCAE